MTGSESTNAPTAPAGDETKKKINLDPRMQSILETLTKREGAWMLFTLACVVLNYTPLFRFNLETITIWTFVQVVLVALILLAMSIWLLWTQISAIEFWTREEAPIKDSQGSDDVGWNFWPLMGFGFMYAMAVFGFILSLIAPDRVPTFVIHGMYISWTMVIFTPFVFAMSEIDRGTIATMFQRTNRLRQRFMRDNH